MLLKLSYTSTDRVWLTQNSYRTVTQKCELEPVAIIRQQTGPRAPNKFYYFALTEE